MRKLIWLSLLAGNAMACDLKVDSAWIREAPSNATSLAGYAVLSNGGSKPITLVSAQSAAFGSVEMHESLNENGMAKMRSIDKLDIPAGGKVEFAPGGKHFMLISPKSGLRSGDAVAVKIKDVGGCETTAQFKISKGAISGATEMDHSAMNLNKLTH